MLFKDYVILTCCSLFLGWTLTNGGTKPVIKDTIKPIVDTPIVLNVKDKTALFIGDSHTANHQNGWQIQLSKAVGFKMINASVGGKTTYWMLDQAVYRINGKIDYVFVYGGANDMYSQGIEPKEAVDNIRGIARIANGIGAKCIVLTGFDAKKCVKTNNVGYPGRYSKFQEILLHEGVAGATVVDTRVIDRTDCWDGLCHMNGNGHKKIAEKIIKDLVLQKI